MHNSLLVSYPAAPTTHTYTEQLRPRQWAVLRRVMEVWKAKNGDLLRSHYGQLCTVLASAEETQMTFAGRLFEKYIIDMQTKNAVLRTKGLEGANILVDRVMMKMDLRPERLEIVLKIMEELEDLQDTLAKLTKDDMQLK